MSLVYLDTSVALAHLLAEDRRPSDDLWSHSLVSSRLLEYETWVRVNAMKLHASHGDAVRELLAGIAFLELDPVILARATEPFPVAVRTLDALHLASMDFLIRQGQAISLATYDDGQLLAARRMGLTVHPL